MRTSGESGVITLFVVLGAGIFALGTALTLATGILSEVRKSGNTAQGDRMFYAAEANLSEGRYQYLNNDTYSGALSAGLFNSASSSDITVSDIGWPYVQVRGSASGGDTIRATVHTLTVFPEGQAFNHAVYSENDLTVGGSAQINGSIFANNGIDFTGSNAEINGDAYSPDDIDDQHDNVNGESFEGVDPISPPTIDSTPYLAQATADGTVFASGAALESYLNNQTRSGVLYQATSDDVHISGSNTELTGSLVSFGNTRIQGGTFSGTDEYAAVVIYGDLEISGGTTINGVVYATGSVAFGSGNNTVNGTIIAAGGVSAASLTGNTTINYDPDLATVWPDLTGLNTTSTEEPKVIYWGEE